MRSNNIVNTKQIRTFHLGDRLDKIE